MLLVDVSNRARLFQKRATFPVPNISYSLLYLLGILPVRTDINYRKTSIFLEQTLDSEWVGLETR